MAAPVSTSSARALSTPHESAIARRVRKNLRIPQKCWLKISHFGWWLRRGGEIAGSRVWWPAASSWVRLGRGHGPGGVGVGQQIGMAAGGIAGALDADDDGVVEEAIQQRGGDDGVAEHLTPFGKAAVGGEDHGAALVAGIDQLKEQVPAAGEHRQVADLVDHEELRPAEEPDTFPQGALTLGFGQRADELGQRGEVDT